MDLMIYRLPSQTEVMVGVEESAAQSTLANR